MALTLLIDGVDRTDLYHDGSLRITKVLGSETAELEILDEDSTAAAYRTAVDQEVVIYHNSDLIMGGTVSMVGDSRIIDEYGAATLVSVRDWMYILERTFVGRRRFPSQPAFPLFDALITEYLAARGFTNVSPLLGGPVLPEIIIDRHDFTLADLWARITELIGYPHRINGLKECGLVEPGSLIWPGGVLSETNATVLVDPTPSQWTQESIRQANRLFLETAVPDGGPGPYEHVETRVADGVRTIFPVNVLPTVIEGAASAAGSGGTSTLSIERLPNSATVRIGARFQIAKHTTLYEVSSGTTTSGTGTVTVGLVVPLEKDVEVGDGVTFLPNAFVQLELDGVATPMDGAPWVWDQTNEAMVNPSAAPAAGVVVGYRTWITAPTVVRVWETSSPPVQTAIGGFDRAVLLDDVIPGEEHTDLAEAAAYGREALSRRLVAPKRFALATHETGIYPFITLQGVDFAERLISGDLLVEEVEIQDVGIDPATSTQELRYLVTATEGDALNESHIAFFKGRNPSKGLRWGSVQNDLYVSQAALEIMTSHDVAHVSQSAVEAMMRDAQALAYVSQAAVEVSIA